VGRQQAFLGAVARQVLSAGTLLNPIRLNQLLDAVSKWLTTDADLDPLKLANQLRDIAAGNVIFKTVPIANLSDSAGVVSDGVKLDKAKLRSFFAAIINGHAGSPAPKRRLVRGQLPSDPRQSGQPALPPTTAASLKHIDAGTSWRAHSIRRGQP
jgi:anionic cell wall polymer biosynthesis LytR-Cps2A-Psr (LCP) family protein